MRKLLVTDLEKSLSVLNNLLHYFREAVTGIEKSDFEGEREFEEEKRLKEFWLHPDDFTYNEWAVIENTMENCYGISQDVDVTDLVKMKKHMELRLEREAHGVEPEKGLKRTGGGKESQKQGIEEGTGTEIAEKKPWDNTYDVNW